MEEREEVIIFSPKTVSGMIDVCRTTLYLWSKDGLFPVPVRLGPKNNKKGKVGYLASEVYAWIESRERIGKETAA